MRIFGGVILKSMVSTSSSVDSKSYIIQIGWRETIALSTAFPATLATIYYMKFHSLRQIQTIGFSIVSIMFLVTAISFLVIQKNHGALYGIYCALLFSLAFGPAVTAYVLPSTIYPRQIRSTMTGISAALGKLGALTGMFLFGTLAGSSTFALSMVMFSCSFLAILGSVITFLFIPETTVLILREEDGIMRQT